MTNRTTAKVLIRVMAPTAVLMVALFQGVNGKAVISYLIVMALLAGVDAEDIKEVLR